MRKFAFILLFLLPFACAAFQRIALRVAIDIKEDGSASITEEIRFLMTDSEAVNLYEWSRKSVNTLGGWRARIKYDDLRYHVDTSLAPISGTRLQALPPDTCDYLGRCYGTFVIEYSVLPPANGKGIVKITKYAKPRTITYEFLPSALAFEATDGERAIGERTTLELTIPKDAKVVTIYPRPVEFEFEHAPSKFTWQGYRSLAGMQLVFERRESMAEEIRGLFADIQTALYSWFTSKEGIVLTAVAIILAIAFALLRR